MVVYTVFVAKRVAGDDVIGSFKISLFQDYWKYGDGCEQEFEELRE